jgi:DNA repair protein RecO (recombination protein O)
MSSKLYRDTAIVLRTYRLGEADRIIVFLTQEHGKVRAIAKGVRKTRSKFGGRLEPLSCVLVQLHRGRDLDVISQVETVDANRAMFGDLDSMTEAFAMLEAVDQLVPDREPVPHIYKMLAGARQTLLTRPSPIIVPAFLWKLLSAEGLRPQLDACASCAETITLDPQDNDRTRLSFDIALGGVLCRSCGSNTGAGVSHGARELMRRILGGNLNEVLDEAFDPRGQHLDDPIVNEVLSIATAAFEHHMERRLRSVRIFERE